MAILIVDDSPDQHLLLRSILLKAGHDEIVEADSAREAFTALNLDGTQAPINIDLILMDVLMPDIDGVTACRRIKQQDHLRDIPIIMVTSSSMPAASYSVKCRLRLASMVFKVSILR